jgi:methionyl-tRNA formyltransferase
MNKGAFSGLISFQVIWDLRKLSQLDILEVAIFQTSGSPRAPKSPKEILTFAWRSILTLREHLLAVTAFFLIPKKVQIYFCKDINLDQNVKKILSSASSAFIVIRGGRILSKETLKCFEGVWVNIHGGILPFYRGLDSHLWAIARKDFDRIGVTVHLMTEKIDEGIILWKESISVKPSENLG